MDRDLLEEIEAKLFEPTDDLYREIGLAATGKGGTGRDPVPRGKAILASLTRECEEAICTNRTVHAAIHKHDDYVMEVSAVLDCIGPVVTPLNVSPVTASTLIVRVGLDSLCGPRWASGGGPPRDGRRSDNGISNVSKMLHDTARAIIRKIGG